MSQAELNIISTSRTLANLEERRANLSWTKIKQAKGCPLSMLGSNYMAPASTTAAPKKPDETYGVPGTLVQRALEMFVNNQIFTRPNFNTMGDLVRYLSNVSRSSAALTIKDISFYDHLLEYHIDPRKYFRTDEGKRILEQKIHSGSIYPEMKNGNQLKFIDPKNFDRIYTSLESLLDHIDTLYLPILQSFHKMGVNLRATRSEVWFRAEYRKYKMMGAADFLVNQQAGTTFDPRTMYDLKPGYVIMDGKYNVNSFTDPEQLNFYGAALLTQTKKAPAASFLIDWNKAAFSSPYKFDLAYMDQLDHYLDLFDAIYADVIAKLKSTDADAVPISFFASDKCPAIPSTSNCKFCEIREDCEVSMGKTPPENQPQ